MTTILQERHTRSLRYHFTRRLYVDEAVTSTGNPFVAVVNGTRYLVVECSGDDCYECQTEGPNK